MTVIVGAGIIPFTCCMDQLGMILRLPTPGRYSSQEEGRTVDPAKTWFDCGSCARLVCALAALRLIEVRVWSMSDMWSRPRGTLLQAMWHVAYSGSEASAEL